MLGWADTRLLEDVLPSAEAKAINKAFGYETCADLLGHFPRRFSRRVDDTIDITELADGEWVTMIATVRQSTRVNQGRGRGSRVHLQLTNGLEVVFFRAHHVRIPQNSTVLLSGKISFFHDTPQLSHPDYLVLDNPGNLDADKSKVLYGGKGMNKLYYYDMIEFIVERVEFFPIYPATEKVPTWRIMGAIWKILNTMAPVRDPLELEISLTDAMWQCHFPTSAGVDAARDRLKLHEALCLALVMEMRRIGAQQETAPVLKHSDLANQLIDGLGFVLTEDQRRAIDEISTDLRRNYPMTRLLQGEVGSGKTIVALTAMLHAVGSNTQCALLVPTEVLASQHARSLSATLQRAGVDVSVTVLTGSMPTAAKRQALLDIVSGKADIVVGTHALIQDSVEFFDLGLVVVDEQHRFGVEQRDRLRDKGRLTPHLLVMTATPIPRTIAMTIYGDLEVSTIKQLPGGRQPIVSSVVPAQWPRWTKRAWDRIEEELAQGRQAYVVCPRIDSEGGVLAVAEKLGVEISDEYRPTGPAPSSHKEAGEAELFAIPTGALSEDDLLADVPDKLQGARIGIVHGRMAPMVKDRVMQEFAAGDLNVLISTTVIEVGVDVGNATVMMVRESERFGLSQLHQLRGRVGRGEHKSVCLFHTRALQGSEVFERIQDLAETTNGFEVADLDFVRRREGDILGTQQSGTQGHLKLLDLAQDSAIIEMARVQASHLVSSNSELAEEIISDINPRDMEFLRKS